MGVNHGSDVLYHLTGLEKADCAAIMRGLYEERKVTGKSIMAQPTIDGDSNNICYVVASKAPNKSLSVGHFYSEWAQCGIKVTPVVDGDVRPTSKQATNKRVAQGERARIKGHVLLKEACTIKRGIANGVYKTPEDLMEAKKQILTKEKSGRKLLNQSECKIPIDFAAALEDIIVNDLCVRSPNNSGGFVGPVMKAKFQADAAIIGRFLNGETTMAITSDSDIPILAGDEFISLKEFTKDGNMTMVSTSKSTLLNAMKYLPNDSKKRVKLEDALCPVFESVESRRVRALMMVMLGCDVYGPGMKQIGPVKLKAELTSVSEKLPASSGGVINDEQFYDALLKHVAQFTRLGVSVVDSLVRGIIFEPTNAVAAVDDGGLSTIVTEADHTYFDGVSPDYLPEYLSDMACPETNLDDAGPTILLCQGVVNRPHLFLGRTGWNRCGECNKVICGTCSTVTQRSADNAAKKSTYKLCLGCYATQMLVPSNTNLEYFRRVEEMRKELKDRFKMDDVDKMSFDEVEEAYEKAVLALSNHQHHKIKYPLHPTAELKEPTAWKHLFDLEFCKGGAFISDPDPNVRNNLPALLNLLASCVTYEKKKHTDWVKDPTVYDALPANIIQFAKDSRIDSGYRLLERCVRHAHDPRMQSVFDNIAQIIQLPDGSLGMIIEMQVPASMKSDIYTTTVAYTSKDVLAVECSCKSGSKGDDTVVCVHVLPISYKVTMLLLEGLAEHVLMELTANYASLKEVWTADNIISVKQSSLILMDAAGETISHDDAMELSLETLLERFLTGTEKTKTWGRCCVSSPSAQGPITKLSLTSSSKEAKDLKERNKKQRGQVVVEEECNSTLDRELFSDSDASPSYLRVKMMMDAAGVGDSKSTKVGFRLLEKRANAEMQTMTCDEVLQMREESVTAWTKLKHQCEQRSFRIADHSKQNLRQPPTRKRKRSTKSTTANSSPPNLRRRGQLLPIRKKKTKQQHHSYCARLGCNVTNLSHPHTKFHRLPAMPKPLPPNAKRARYIKREGKVILRKETFDRCHFKRDVEGGNYRCCEEHEFEWVVKSVQLSWKGKRFTQSYNLYVPKGEGPKSTMCQKTNLSRGNANDRRMRQQLAELNNQIIRRPNTSFVEAANQPMHDTSAESAAADAAESRKLVMQMAEETSSDTTSIKMNPSVAVEAGLAFDERYSPPIKTPNKTFFNSSLRTSPTASAGKNFAANKPPILTLGTPDKEIKRRTGFVSEAAMLSYIFVVCHGDCELIGKRNSSLTWYEEWVFHFEWKYGRTLTRWTDAAKAFGPAQWILREICRQKLHLERRIHGLWPKFVSYQEDCLLRKPKWELKYGERNSVKTRIIMWDMTGIRSYQFGGAKVQRDTYSKYYAGNCFKGGIFTQLCGWIGVHELWGGNVSDSNYNEMAGYLDEQWSFQNVDLVDGCVVPFTNVYDKGYRARAVCWRKGKQLVAQPIYAKSDQRFKGSDTLISASIASDRGGNERGVNISKRSGVIKRGFKANMDTQMFQDTWITWAFQANFMYDPVL